jgi:hypothetical protein
MFRIHFIELAEALRATRPNEASSINLKIQ